MTTASVSDLSLEKSAQRSDRPIAQSPLFHLPLQSPRHNAPSVSQTPVPSDYSGSYLVPSPRAAHHATHPGTSSSPDQFLEKTYSLSASSSWQSESLKPSSDKAVKGKSRGGHRDKRVSPGNDVEKASRSRPTRTTNDAPVASARVPCSVRYIDDDDEDQAEKHLSRILFYLAFLAPSVSFILSIYALLAITLSAISAPLYLYTTRQPASRQVCVFLSPILRLQLRFMYSTYVNAPTSTPRARTISLVTLGSPFYAIGVSIASWVAAAFWFYAAILGDPSEEGGRDRDGRNAVRGVRKLWERWLLVGLAYETDIEM